MTLTTFRTPFNVFDEALARFTEPSEAQTPAAAQVWTPAVDVIETEHEIILKADLPGVVQSEIEVKFENGALTI